MWAVKTALTLLPLRVSAILGGIKATTTVIPKELGLLTHLCARSFFTSREVPQQTLCFFVGADALSPNFLPARILRILVFTGFRLGNRVNKEGGSVSGVGEVIGGGLKKVHQLN